MKSYVSQGHQTGAALVIALLMLLILTVLGVSSMRTTVLEERMTSNARNVALAMQAAETALRDAETIIDDEINHLGGFGQLDGHYTEEMNEPDILDPSEWTTTSSAMATTEVAGTTPAAFMIKDTGRYLGEGSLNSNLRGYDGGGVGSPPPNYFRVTVRGLGGDGVATVVLQANVADRLQDN